MVISIFIALYVLSLAMITFLGQVALGTRSSSTWAELVGRFNPARTEGLMKVAAVANVPNGDQSHGTFSEMFTSIGGQEGVARIRRNVDILMALAAYIEVWSPEANHDSIALMRKEGTDLRRATTKLILCIRFSNRYNLASVYLIEVAQLYCSLIERLLTLCKAVHVARYPALVAAVNW